MKKKSRSQQKTLHFFKGKIPSGMTKCVKIQVYAKKKLCFLKLFFLYNSKTECLWYKNWNCVKTLSASRKHKGLMLFFELRIWVMGEMYFFEWLWIFMIEINFGLRVKKKWQSLIKEISGEFLPIFIKFFVTIIFRKKPLLLASYMTMK